MRDQSTEVKTLRAAGLGGLLLALAVLGAISYSSYRNWMDFRNADAEANHGRRVLTLSQQVADSTRDAETGQRGFIITGRDSYLEPYNAAIANVSRQLDALASLCRQEPNQARRVAALQPLVREKLEELRQTIDLRRSSRPAAEAVVLTDRGKVLMDQIRTLIATLQSDESARVDASSAALQADTQRSRLLILLGVALLTILLGGAFVALRRAAAQNDKLVASLASSQEAARNWRNGWKPRSTASPMG